MRYHGYLTSKAWIKVLLGTTMAFFEVQGFEKRNDEQALELMNAYVVAVLDELTALYLHIDVVLKKKDQLNQRGASDG
ncbi:putative tRNA(His) guanylyltransferase [Helianthus annuus]|uniref:tRNA(His) guanylyltransferase n=1 Tax=Helianthus annuus TaxID=4232 RepID=A0A9K3HL48_HELAN|nr:putative tRNA(His) guanylyltransferase [Helianthus annuus]KAJ0500220.1 putative tRNA(His) guanylyltransferase [Helianthus annuus]KAJ0507583.1 putative tRNA(His) guanylyltransferase [Helianthus annuus]KAJ0516052.1 putative tRNA(His) guanylyltransferase [Helianthus annuus]KAJ0684069.1 putative tRNA(His) guanylyltransferase [Helianthus annuus]